MPEKRTLAQWVSPSVSASSSSASSVTTSVCCPTPPCCSRSCLIDSNIASRGEFAQLAQLAAVMHGLQLDEIEFGLAQEAFGVESGGDVRLRLPAEGRFCAYAACERGRRRANGFAADARILHIAFGPGPGEQAQHKHHGETDQGHHQQRTQHAPRAAVAEQVAQAQAGGQAGYRPQPAVAGGLGRGSRIGCGGSGSCLRRRSLLCAPARGHAGALRTQAPASAQAPGLGVVEREYQCQERDDRCR